MTVSFNEALDLHYNELKSIMLGKRKLRGPDNITKQGEIGVIRRIADDKLARILKEAEVEDLRQRAFKLLPKKLYDEVNKHLPNASEAAESFEDDLRDIANYCIIVLMLRDGTWQLEG